VYDWDFTQTVLHPSLFCFTHARILIICVNAFARVESLKPHWAISCCKRRRSSLAVLRQTETTHALLLHGLNRQLLRERSFLNILYLHLLSLRDAAVPFLLRGFNGRGLALPAYHLVLHLGDLVLVHSALTLLLLGRDGVLDVDLAHNGDLVLAVLFLLDAAPLLLVCQVVRQLLVGGALRLQRREVLGRLLRRLAVLLKQEQSSAAMAPSARIVVHSSNSFLHPCQKILCTRRVA
jgi:hypothetical protein